MNLSRYKHSARHVTGATLLDMERIETAPAATLAQVRDRATITVGEAAALLGLGRTAGYAAARSGEIPTIRIGRRVVVPVPALLAMLGVEQ